MSVILFTVYFTPVRPELLRIVVYWVCVLVGHSVFDWRSSAVIPQSKQFDESVKNALSVGILKRNVIEVTFNPNWYSYLAKLITVGPNAFRQVQQATRAFHQWREAYDTDRLFEITNDHAAGRYTKDMAELELIYAMRI